MSVFIELLRQYRLELEHQYGPKFNCDVRLAIAAMLRGSCGVLEQQ
jgi:hypothetical protein